MWTPMFFVQCHSPVFEVQFNQFVVIGKICCYNIDGVRAVLTFWQFCQSLWYKIQLFQPNEKFSASIW